MAGLFGAAEADRLRRLSFNFYMAPPDCDIARFCALAAARGAGGVGLTARAVEALSPQALADLLHARDLRCTSLNSTGYVLHAEPAAAAAQARLDNLLFAAAPVLDAPVNVILGGTLHGATATLPALSLRDARQRAASGLARLVARAREAGVRLALEPMHPTALGTKGCINQLSHARALAARHAEVGLTLDFHHSWWDEDLSPPSLRRRPTSSWCRSAAKECHRTERPRAVQNCRKVRPISRCSCGTWMRRAIAAPSSTKCSGTRWATPDWRGCSTGRCGTSLR